MNCNDLNRRVRYALMIDDDDVIELLRLAGTNADTSDVVGWRLKEGEAGFLPCPPHALQQMLDGLIIQRRGAREQPAASAEEIKTSKAQLKTAHKSDTVNNMIDNNDILKQLRIALSLKTDDVHLLISQGGGKLGKSEVNALFRKPSARNFRRCGDQVLRWFLAGLAARRQEQSL